MTIHEGLQWPLEVCCMKNVLAYQSRDIRRGMKRVLGAVLWVAALCSGLAGSAWAQQDPAWIYNEAQWGLPSAPFLFSGNTLYTAGSFESGRQVLIGPSLANIHVLGGTRLHLTGTISNQESGISGLQKFGAGTLVLSGQNTYRGNTQLHEGTLHIVGENALGRRSNALLAYRGSVVHYAPGTSVFNQQHLRESSEALGDSVQWRVDSGVAVQAGNVQGSVPVVKQGLGKLRLIGIVSYPSFFTVNQGTLAVDWHVGGSVQVNQGARLEGGGIVRSVSIQGGGVLSPGEGLGDTAVMTLTEKLEFKPGAVFEIDAKPSGVADFVQVAGKALLDGQVMTRASAGDWQPRTRYAVLQATDGFDGTRFASATTNLPFLTPALSYDEQTVYVSLSRNGTPLEEVTETPTEEEVAEKVDEGANPGLHDDVVVMDRPQAREAFNQLSGSWMASVRSSMLEDSRFVREAVLRSTGFAPAASAMQDGAVRQDAPRAWSQAFYSSDYRAVQGGTPADARDIGGLVLGIEQPLSAHWRAGAFFGAQRSDMRRRHAMATAGIDSLHAGLSLAGRWRDVDLAVGVARTWHKIRSHRSIAVAGLQDALSGNYRGRTLQVFGEIAAPIRWFGKALAGLGSSVVPADSSKPSALPAVSPFVRMAWVQANTSGFTERGGAAALVVLPESQAVLLSTLGLRAEHRIETPTGIAMLRGELAWRHASGNARAFSRQSFRDDATQSVFESEGLPLARQAWSLQLGVKADLAKHVSLGVAYAGQFASRRQDHGARVDVAWVF